MSASPDEKLVQSVARSPLAIVFSIPRRSDNRLEMVNEAFCQLTGYSEVEVTGRNCRFLAGGR